MRQEKKFLNQLKSIFEAIHSESICVHSAIPPLGFFPFRGNKKASLEAYLEMVINASENRTLLFPTFNYDFCKDGVYDLQRSRCQVGVLNECARLSPLSERTHTPVFNFSILRNCGYSRSACTNVFGAGSTFDELVQKKATILFIGPNLVANTFAHRVEEFIEVGYRYPKVFRGVIRPGAGGVDYDFKISYRVRPPFIDTSKDWDALGVDLRERGYLKELPLGSGVARFYRADHVFEYWCACLKKDELFFSSPRTRKNIEMLYEKYGKPLTLEKVEA